MIGHKLSLLTFSWEKKSNYHEYACFSKNIVHFEIFCSSFDDEWCLLLVYLWNCHAPGLSKRKSQFRIFKGCVQRLIDFFCYVNTYLFPICWSLCISSLLLTTEKVCLVLVCSSIFTWSCIKFCVENGTKASTELKILSVKFGWSALAKKLFISKISALYRKPIIKLRNYRSSKKNRCGE